MYIKKIRFKVEDFGLGTIDMKTRYVYEIYPDGRWIEYTYQGESNRYTYKDICVTKKENVLRLYNKYQKLFIWCTIMEKEYYGSISLRRIWIYLADYL